MVLDVLGVFQCPAQVAFLQVTLEHIAPANHTGKGKGPNREGHKQAFAHAGEHSVYADMSKNLMVDDGQGVAVVGVANHLGNASNRSAWLALVHQVDFDWRHGSPDRRMAVPQPWFLGGGPARPTCC